MLQEIAVLAVASRCSEMNSSGLTSPLPMRILMSYWKVSQRSSFWLPVYVHWQLTGMGSVLNLSIMENPSVAPSTDPIYSVTAYLTECLVLQENYATFSWLLCTSLTSSWKGTSPIAPRSLRLQNRSSVSDEIYLVQPSI